LIDTIPLRFSWKWNCSAEVLGRLAMRELDAAVAAAQLAAATRDRFRCLNVVDSLGHWLRWALVIGVNLGGGYAK
jgi:hypothetical protein